MIGEVSLNGIYLPTLLVLALLATPATMLLMRILDTFGFYRFVAYRALVDLALYVIVFGLLALLASHFGVAP